MEVPGRGLLSAVDKKGSLMMSHSYNRHHNAIADFSILFNDRFLYGKFKLNFKVMIAVP